MRRTHAVSHETPVKFVEVEVEQVDWILNCGRHRYRGTVWQVAVPLKNYEMRGAPQGRPPAKRQSRMREAGTWEGEAGESRTAPSALDPV